jgi:hypothetical protein
MKHFASREFWQAYRQLPDAIRDLADKNFALLKTMPRHPSLHLKRVAAFGPCESAYAIVRSLRKLMVACSGSESAPTLTTMAS